MAVTLTPADLAPFAQIENAKALAMIEDALALAARVAPCIATDEYGDDDDLAVPAARAILRAAILRWNDAGSGAYQSQTAGPYGVQVDTRVQRKSMFWPSEIEQLQQLCQGSDETSGAFAIDTGLLSAIVHADICSLNFGAVYCSCGAVLTGSYPLWEV